MAPADDRPLHSMRLDGVGKEVFGQVFVDPAFGCLAKKTFIV